MSDQGEAKTKTVGFLPIDKVQTLPGWDDYLDKSIKLAALRTETQKAKNTVRQALKLRLNENDDIDFVTEGDKIRVFRVFRKQHQGRRTLDLSSSFREQPFERSSEPKGIPVGTGGDHIQQPGPRNGAPTDPDEGEGAKVAS